MKKYLLIPMLGLPFLFLVGKGTKPTSVAEGHGTTTLKAGLSEAELPVAPKKLAIHLKKEVPASSATAVASPREAVIQGAALGDKVLRTASEQEQYRALLASKTAINEAYSMLQDVSRKARTKEAEDARMRAVDFLGSAAGWKSNPARPFIVQKITGLLERSIEGLNVPYEFKKSLAGDAVELFAVLKATDEEAANKLVSRSSEAQRKMFQFASNEYRVKGEEFVD